jgi:predicted DNA-binding WGR domain protein
MLGDRLMHLVQWSSEARALFWEIEEWSQDDRKTMLKITYDILNGNGKLLIHSFPDSHKLNKGFLPKQLYFDSHT